VDFVLLPFLRAHVVSLGWFLLLLFLATLEFDLWILICTSDTAVALVVSYSALLSQVWLSILFSNFGLEMKYN
jgi:hypothetical protein